MWKMLVLTFVSLTLTLSGRAFTIDDDEQWNKTREIKELPFCAFILRDFLDEDDQNREIYVFTEPERVTESNLYLLFRLLSQRFPKPEKLKVWVNTDVEQLGLLATGRMGTSVQSEERAKKAGTAEINAFDVNDDRKKGALQFAYYKRTKEVELYRFNPNYPLSGIKTVIIRGKEE